MVSLTKKGADLLRHAENHRTWVGDMMADLSPDEMKGLYELLARLKASILAAEDKNSLEAAE